MVKGLIGKKMNMSQVSDSHGRVAPVTKVLLEPNFVIQIRTQEKDGYRSAQLGSGKAKKLTKPLQGHVKKSKTDILPRTFREFSFDGDLSEGQPVNIDDVFHKGSLVDVIGISKGKGFAGVVKRHGFAGGPRTHGQSDRERAPGSIGATTTPGRVLKGTKMAGHIGMERVKVQALEILDIDKENNILVLKGSVPGFSGSTLLIEKSKKKKKKYNEPEIPATPSLGKKDEDEVKEENGLSQEGVGVETRAVEKGKIEENENGKGN